MKKIITTASIAALGAMTLQAAGAGVSSGEQSKPWNVAASLRGFYDDNYTTSPSATARESFGIQVSPSASLNLPLDLTTISLSYQYSMKWYEDRDKNSADHSHIFNAKVNHKFSDNYRLDLTDSFVIAQEPEVIDPSQKTSVMRMNGNNMRNIGGLKFGADLTRLFGVELGYSNSWYDYDNEGAGSYSALLDRMEHLITFDTRWHVLPKTIGILGYQFGITEYDSKFAIIPGVMPEVRDNYSHYFYAGVDQNINEKLNGSLRIGAQYNDYHEAEKYAGYASDDTSLTPYADSNLTYAYAVGSYAQLGVKHSKLATDMYALDQEATTVYGSVNHQITPKLMASLLGEYQLSSFDQGLTTVDGRKDNYFMVGLNLTYTINKYLAAETGYNFDRLDSDISNRSFTRNRVYLGLRASY